MGDDHPREAAKQRVTAGSNAALPVVEKWAGGRGLGEARRSAQLLLWCSGEASLKLPVKEHLAPSPVEPLDAA